MGRRRWPPLIIHSISPQDRAAFFAFRDAIRNRERAAAASQRAEPPRHTPSALGTETIEASERSRGCVPPISDDFTRLQVTERWCRHRFLPAYVDARKSSRDPYDIVEKIYARELPHCLEVSPTTAVLELVRRVHLSVAILARSEGIDAKMPYQPSYPCATVRPDFQPWLLALLTGWP